VKPAAADQLDVCVTMGIVLQRALAAATGSGHPSGHTEGIDVVEVLDLGAGGGVPGLVIATAWPTSAWRWMLLDAHQRRVHFLAEAAASLGLAERVDVVGERAERVGRDPLHRERYGAVVARGFGAPAATAEVAAPLVRLGGCVLGSEPPESTGARWPGEPRAELGLVRQGVHPGIPPVVELRRTLPCPDWAPRRVGVPAKRPYF